jgi:hypothetical protein
MQDAAPSKDLLESVLVQLEVDLQHSLYHWHHLVAILRQHALWMEEDLDFVAWDGPSKDPRVEG